MRRVYQIAALVCLASSLWVIVESRQLKYYTAIGPGAGFFPFWLGIFFGGLSIVWLGTVSLRPVEPMAPDFVPDRGGILRIAAVISAVAVFSLLVDTVGFQFMMFAFLLFLLTVLGRKNLLLTLVLALAGSVGVYYLFRIWLDVQLPVSSIELLQNLGL